MAIRRLKQNFTAGEMSPKMEHLTEFDRLKNGCRTMRNAVAEVQGAATSRPGLQYIADLADHGIDPENPLVRMIPFIFNETQAYVMIFFMHTDGAARMVLGYGDGLVVGGATVGGTSTTPCPPGTTTVAWVDELTAYDFTFLATAIDEVSVTHVATADSAETELTYTTDYTVALDTPSGGTVTPVDNATTQGLPAGNLVITHTGSDLVDGTVVYLDLHADFDIETFDYAQTGDTMYLAQAGLQPHIIERHAHDCWEFSALTVTDQPSEWTSAGWPETVSFFQQRCVYGGSAVRRQVIWLSKAGDFEDFGDSSPVVSADSLSFQLDSDTKNRILWLSTGKSLAVGTMGGEWTVSGASSHAISPSSVQALRHTQNGSEKIKPLKISQTTLFVEKHGRVVNEFSYNYQYDSFETNDITVLAPHLTEQYSITDWTYQQTPMRIVWSRRSDGTLLGLTYQRKHKVVGWHRHDTRGSFLTTATIPGTNREDEVWFVVNRDIGGTDSWYVEKFGEFFTGTLAEQSTLLDSHVLSTGEPTDEITSGLEHLEGMNVSVLADGTVHPDVTVQSGGIILNGEYSTLLVGLPFSVEIEPILPDVPMEGGTSVMHTQRILKLDVSFYKTLGASIIFTDAAGNETEYEIPFMDTLGPEAQPLFTGVKEFQFPLDYKKDAAYVIKQELPLPLTVRGVVDTYEVDF